MTKDSLISNYKYWCYKSSKHKTREISCSFGICIFAYEVHISLINNWKTYLRLEFILDLLHMFNDILKILSILALFCVMLCFLVDVKCSVFNWTYTIGHLYILYINVLLGSTHYCQVLLLQEDSLMAQW